MLCYDVVAGDGIGSSIAIIGGGGGGGWPTKLLLFFGNSPPINELTSR